MNGEPAGRLHRVLCAAAPRQEILTLNCCRAALGLLIMFVFDPEFELEMCGGGSL